MFKELRQNLSLKSFQIFNNKTILSDRYPANYLIMLLILSKINDKRTYL
jgi:hypothetical protein